MADENKGAQPRDKENEEEVLDVDPLTGGKTVAQQATPDENIRPLPTTTDSEGNESRTGDFDETTGAAHPAEDSGADKGVSK